MVSFKDSAEKTTNGVNEVASPVIAGKRLAGQGSEWRSDDEIFSRNLT